MCWIMHYRRSYKLQWQASATVKVTVLINFAEEKFEHACCNYAQIWLTTHVANVMRMHVSATSSELRNSRITYYCGGGAPGLVGWVLTPLVGCVATQTTQ